MCADQRESFYAAPLPPPPAQEQAFAQRFEDDDPRRSRPVESTLLVRLADLVTT